MRRVIRNYVKLHNKGDGYILKRDDRPEDSDEDREPAYLCAACFRPLKIHAYTRYGYRPVRCDACGVFVHCRCLRYYVDRDTQRQYNRCKACREGVGL